MQPRSIAATEQTSDWISEDGRQQVDEQTSGNVPNDEMKPEKETVAEQTYGLVPHQGVMVQCNTRMILNDFVPSVQSRK